MHSTAQAEQVKTIEKQKEKSKELLQSIAKPLNKHKKNKDLSNCGEHGGLPRRPAQDFGFWGFETSIALHMLNW